MKHTIKSDGAPFKLNLDGEYVPVNEDKSTAGAGVAVCSCGDASSQLPTRAARKAWHAQHKENTVTEQNHEQETPEPEEVAEPTETHDAEQATVTVGNYPEKKLLPAYFFGSIIRLGLAPALEGHASVESHSERDLTVTVSGEQETLEEVEELVKGIYETLPAELAAFKKEFKPKAEGKEGHKESWIARRDFCVEFARGFTAEFFQEADDSFARAYSAGVAACARTFAIEGDIDNSDELL